METDDNQNMSTAIISLLQKYTREDRVNNKGESSEEYIQFRLYRILNDQDAEVAKKTGKYLYANQLESCGSTGAYINKREVTKRFRVAPGNYLIIPSCYDAEISGEFLLRVYTEKAVDDNNCAELKERKQNPTEEDLEFSKPSSLDALFRRWTNFFRTNSSYVSKTAETADFSKQHQENVSSSANLGPESNEDICYVAPTRLYVNDAFVDIYNKVDIYRSKRLTKMLKIALPIF